MPETYSSPTRPEPAAEPAEPCTCHADAIARGEAILEMCQCDDDVAARARPHRLRTVTPHVAPTQSTCCELWLRGVLLTTFVVIGLGVLSIAFVPAAFVALLLLLLPALPLLAVMLFTLLTLEMRPEARERLHMAAAERNVLSRAP